MIAGADAFDVRRLRSEELASFQAGVPAWNEREYDRRLSFQERGLAVQLVAWAGPDAVGKAMVVFPGHVEWSPSAYREGCPELRDVEVIPAWTRRGVGTALIAAAEGEVRAAGFDRIGLSVGVEPGYAPARAMYERAGYRAAHGPFVTAARLEGDDGRPIGVAGVCMYLVKGLGEGQPS